MRLAKYIETDKAFYKKLLIMAIPLAAQNLITVGVNLVDNIMVGRLGEAALSGVTQANHYIALFQYCIMGISMGSSVLTARFWGARDSKSLKQTITIALRLALILSAAVALLTSLCANPIMYLYSNESEVISGGVDYLMWSLPTFFLLALSTVCTNVLRSVGIGWIPLIASIGAFFVNIGANYVLIFGKLGLPAMGVAGAALGTVIARMLEFSTICGYFFLLDKQIGYRFLNLFGKCRGLVAEYLRISMPVMFSDGLLGVGDNALAVIMGRIGQQFVAASSITNTTQRVSTIFITSMAFSSCFMISQVLGEGNVQKEQKQGYTFFCLGVLIGLLGALFIQLVKYPIIGAYNITEETVAITIALMNAISLIVVFRATNSILTKGVLRGGGDTRFLMVADIMFQWVAAIPLGYLAGLVLHLPSFWIYFCLNIDHVLKAVWCIWRLRSGKWIKQISGVTDER